MVPYQWHNTALCRSQQQHRCRKVVGGLSRASLRPRLRSLEQHSSLRQWVHHCVHDKQRSPHGQPPIPAWAIQACAQSTVLRGIVAGSEHRAKRRAHKGPLKAQLISLVKNSRNTDLHLPTPHSCIGRQLVCQSKPPTLCIRADGVHCATEQRAKSSLSLSSTPIMQACTSQGAR